MRAHVLTILALLLIARVATAQGTAPVAKDPPPALAQAMSPKNQKFLDAYLKAWEDRMSKIDALQTKIIFTETGEETNPATGKKIPANTVFTGEASLLKPNLAKMFLKLDAKPADNRRWKHFIADGKFMWDYQYSQKVVRVQPLPAEGLSDNTILAFLFGMKADAIKKRYDLSIDVDDPKKITENYLFIDILPKTKEDKQEFARAQLALWINNKEPKYADYWMLPARLWFQQTNTDGQTWEFRNMTSQKKLPKSDFEAPGFLDKAWKSEWMQSPTAKPVSRPVGPAK